MIELEDLPELDNPVLIAAFEGWNDAGEAATAVIEHLATVWEAEAVAALDPEDYYDFQVNRPRIVIDGGSRRIHWRTTRILVATRTTLGRDVVLIQGIEPSFRWRAFTIELMEFAQEVGASHDHHAGGPDGRRGPHPADPRHRAPPTTTTPGTGSTWSASSYEGPTGIVGVLADAATPVGLQSISCWAAVPHYAAHSPSPKATLALLRLEELLDVPIALATCPRTPGLGARRRRAGRRPTTRSRSTSSPSRRPRTPPTYPRPVATRSPASSSATCAAAEDGPAGPPEGLRAQRPRRVRPDAEEGVDAPRERRPGAAGSSPPSARHCSAQRSTAARAAGVSRSSASGRRTRSGRHPSASGPVLTDSAARQGQPRLRRAPAASVGPLPVGTVVLGEQDQPDRHRVDARARAASRRAPGCPWTCSSSRREADHRLVDVARGERALAGERLRPGWRSSRGAGRSGRCRRPGRRTGIPRWSRAIAVHSMCHPGRPGPSTGWSHEGSPGRAARHSNGSSASRLPARSGSPPRSA